MILTPQQLAFPSLSFDKDRTVLHVGEAADKWKVTNQHVINLIEEGKLIAFDVAGKHEYIRVPQAAIAELSRRSGLAPETILGIILAAKAQLGRNRAFYRIPVVEGFEAFMRENHSLAVAGK